MWVDSRCLLPATLSDQLNQAVQLHEVRHNVPHSKNTAKLILGQYRYIFFKRTHTVSKQGLQA